MRGAQILFIGVAAGVDVRGFPADSLMNLSEVDFHLVLGSVGDRIDRWDAVVTTALLHARHRLFADRLFEAGQLSAPPA